MAEPVLLAKHGDTECHLLPAMATRHGLITGATGTGKTVTLQTLIEGLSGIGVPVFMADVKGDLTGISQPGVPSPKLLELLHSRGGATTAPRGGVAGVLFGSTGPRGGRRQGLIETAAASAVRTIGSTVGRELVRGVLGSMTGSKRRT